jgi:dipeptidase E
MSKILLTSTGLSNEQCVEIVKNNLLSFLTKNAVIITTASRDKENNKWNIISRNQLLELGYEKVDFIDLEIQKKVDFSQYSLILVSGGNTFKLLKYVNESNFKDELIKSISRGIIYIGVSAGAIILTPTIRIAGEIDPDENEVRLENLQGMDLIKYEILPHYEENQRDDLTNYINKHKVEVRKISNEEIILEEI